MKRRKPRIRRSPKQLYGSVFRFVTSLNDLREKALILRAGLDDRYVELVKAYIMPQAANMKPDLGIESVRFFLDKDGKQYLYFFDKDGKEAGSCDFDMESYNAVQERDSHSLRRTPIH